MYRFDANVMLGPTNTDREPSFRTPEELLAEMDRLGIGDSLVYSSQARMGDPAAGNLLLLDQIRDHPRLHPCWVLLPPGTSQQLPPEDLVSQMKGLGVGAVRMFPGDHFFPLLERSLRPLLLALAKARIPLLIDTDRKSWAQLSLDWRELLALAESHPRLPLVLLREGGSTARVLFSLWDEVPNIHLDVSYLQQSSIVEEVCGRFGAQRLLFGTNMPEYDPGGPLALLEGAMIEEEQRIQIGGNHLRELLGLPLVSGEAPRRWPVGSDGFRVFDIHGHLGQWSRMYHRDHTPGDLVRRMDQLGVERLVISDLLAIGPDYRKGNDRVGEALAEFPDRLVGYAVYNPNYESEMDDEMSRCFDELGCSGIKLHCMLHDTSTEDPSYRRAFRVAEERACPVLCHVHEGPSPDFLAALLAEHPNAKFIYAHLGGGPRAGLEPLLPVAADRPNLFFDLAMSAMPRATLAWLAGQVPPAQILYGSDYPIMDFSYQLGRVLHAQLPEKVKKMILWSNAESIFASPTRS